MKKGVSVFAALVLFLNLMTGCGGRQTAETDNSFAGSASSGNVSAPVEVDFSQTDAEMFTDRDFETEYDETDGVLIELNGSSASASSDSVRISGTTVTITEEAVYIISGSLDDGMIIVDAPDTAKPRLVLNGVDINSADSAALYILEADKVFVTLAEGSQNTLSNGGSFTAIDENNIDSVIFSKQDLTLNGSGTLTVTSPAGHGIVSKDDLAVTGGTDASGISGGRDGMFGGRGGMASSDGSIAISGGTLNINASGDGIDANGTLTISGGYTVVSGPTQGDTATLDYDISGTITGGTFIGTGASGMAQTFSDSQQGVISVSLGNQSAGTAISLTDQNGGTIITYTPELSFQVVILSSPQIVSGEQYTITVGSVSSQVEAD